MSMMGTANKFINTGVTVDLTKRPMLSDNDVALIVRATLTNQLALFYNEKVKYTPYYKQRFKSLLNPLIKELIKIEAEDFSSFLDAVEGQTDYLHDLQFDMLQEIGKLSPEHFINITTMVKAYVESPKSMMGLANKINKNKK